jgi:hypothetical protein
MNTAEQLGALIGGLIILLAIFQIVRKAGYSTGGAILMILLSAVPVLNIGVLAYFVLAEWPVQRELRLRRDPTSATDEDAISLFREGARFEAHGNKQAALAKYQEVITLRPSSAAAKDAETSIQSLQIAKRS